MRSSGVQTPSSSPAHNSFASVHVEAVGLGVRLADPGVGGRDDDHARDMRLKDPGDRPAVAGHLQRHPVAGIEALREQASALRSGLDPAR